MKSKLCKECETVYDVRLRKDGDSCPYCAGDNNNIKDSSSTGWTDDAIVRYLCKRGYARLISPELVPGKYKSIL